MEKPPSAKTTVTLDVPPEWAIGLKGEIVRGFEAVEKRLDAIETNVDLQGNTVRDVQQRMTAQEVRLNGIEERVSNASMRVKQGSQVDMTHESAIATLVTNQKATDEKVDQALGILTRLDKVAANPMVRRIAYLAGGIVLLYLGAVSTRLQQQVDHAPAIYQPDAGTR